MYVVTLLDHPVMPLSWTLTRDELSEWMVQHEDCNFSVRPVVNYK